MPSPATKLKLVGLSPWDPDCHDGGNTLVNRNQLSYAIGGQ